VVLAEVMSVEGRQSFQIGRLSGKGGNPAGRDLVRKSESEKS